MTGEHPMVLDATHDLFQEAAQWRLIGLLFEPPTADWCDELMALSAEAGDDALHSAVLAARDEASPGLYHSTFGPGGPVPPREVSYRRIVHLGQFLADIADHYRAFAYTPRIAETPDHIATEVGFVAYLRLKQAYAVACGADADADLCRSVACRFVAEHVAGMAHAMADVLQRSNIGYLARTGEALTARIGAPPPSEAEASVPLPMTWTDNDECSCS